MSLKEKAPALLPALLIFRESFLGIRCKIQERHAGAKTERSEHDQMESGRKIKQGDRGAGGHQMKQQ